MVQEEIKKCQHRDCNRPVQPPLREWCRNLCKLLERSIRARERKANRCKWCDEPGGEYCSDKHENEYLNYKYGYEKQLRSNLPVTLTEKQQKALDKIRDIIT